MQWGEEVQIIQEEMRRTIVYYEWKQQWWLEQKDQQTACEDSIQRGITAYSEKQAHYCKCLAEGFAMAWLPFLQSEGIKPEWEDRYHWLFSGKKSSSTMPSGMEKDSESDGEKLEGEIEEEETQERYDAFELDD